VDQERHRVKDSYRDLLLFLLPLHEMAAQALVDKHGDVHREAVRRIEEALASHEPESRSEWPKEVGLVYTENAVYVDTGVRAEGGYGNVAMEVKKEQADAILQARNYSARLDEALSKLREFVNITRHFKTCVWYARDDKEMKNKLPAVSPVMESLAEEVKEVLSRLDATWGSE
jgi:hypothetical protein